MSCDSCDFKDYCGRYQREFAGCDKKTNDNIAAVWFIIIGFCVLCVLTAVELILGLIRFMDWLS